MLGAVCIQETWLDESKSDEEMLPFKINGYKLIQQGSQCSKHGGLAIYLNELYEFDSKNLGLSSSFFEYQCIEVHGGDITDKITICNVYRPPKLNNSDRFVRPFLEDFTKVMTVLSKTKHVCAVTGDFNIDIQK